MKITYVIKQKQMGTYGVKNIENITGIIHFDKDKDNFFIRYDKTNESACTTLSVNNNNEIVWNEDFTTEIILMVDNKDLFYFDDMKSFTRGLVKLFEFDKEQALIEKLSNQMLKKQKIDQDFS